MCSVRQVPRVVATSSRLSPFLLCVLAHLLAAQSVLAAGKDSKVRESGRAAERESKERAAKTACLSGDYATGVALLADLFVSTNDVAYLFNQARCFEQNGRYADAIVRFREYQRKNKQAGNAPDEEAERQAAECQALLDKEKAAAAQPAVSPSLPLAQPVAQPVAETKPTATHGNEPRIEIAQPASEPSAPGSGLRIAGIASMAVGVIGVATGVVLNVKANSLVTELMSSPTSYDRSKVSSQSSYRTFAWLSYGVGATCVVGGAVLYYLGHRQPAATSASSVALLPTVGQGQLGAVLAGAF